MFCVDCIDVFVVIVVVVNLSDENSTTICCCYGPNLLMLSLDVVQLYCDDRYAPGSSKSAYTSKINCHFDALEFIVFGVVAGLQCHCYCH